MLLAKSPKTERMTAAPSSRAIEPEEANRQDIVAPEDVIFTEGTEYDERWSKQRNREKIKATKVSSLLRYFD